MKLEDLIRINSLKIEIHKVITPSKHAKFALKSLNDLYYQNEIWLSTLNCIAVLPVMLWAKEYSEKYNININKLSECGLFLTNKSIEIHTKSYKFMLEIIDTLEQSLSKLNHSELKVFNGIHRIGFGDVSKFMISEHYIDAITKICNLCFKKINKIIDNINKCTSEYDDDMLFVYHDTKQLSKIYYRKNKAWFDSDVSDLMDELDKCMLAIRYAPSDGEIMYRIIQHKIEGLSLSQISDQINKSTTYIIARENLISLYLSYLLFGHNEKINLIKR